MHTLRHPTVLQQHLALYVPCCYLFNGTGSWDFGPLGFPRTILAGHGFSFNKFHHLRHVAKLWNIVDTSESLRQVSRLCKISWLCNIIYWHTWTRFCSILDIAESDSSALYCRHSWVEFCMVIIRLCCWFRLCSMVNTLIQILKHWEHSSSDSAAGQHSWVRLCNIEDTAQSDSATWLAQLSKTLQYGGHSWVRLSSIADREECDSTAWWTLQSQTMPQGGQRLARIEN